MQTGQTTVYLGALYEKNLTTGVTTTYYYAGGTRVATPALAPQAVACGASVRQGITVSYFVGDHLGSTAITANSSGGFYAEQRYKPWGETRYATGTTPTRHRFTGQLEDSEIGLYFYNARYYSAVLGRFLSADTIVPDPKNPQSLNRYAYTINNPLKYTDPSGHCPWCLVGAAIGGAVGFLAYTAGAVINQSGWELGDALVTTGAGVIAGGTMGIGAGIIAASGSTAVATVALAAGASGTAAVATTAVSGPFDGTDLVLNTGISMATGAIQGLIPGAGPVASAIRVGAGALGIGITSELSDGFHGRSVDVAKAQALGVLTTLTGAISDNLSSRIAGNSIKQALPSVEPWVPRSAPNLVGDVDKVLGRYAPAKGFWGGLLDSSVNQFLWNLARDKTGKFMEDAP